ncbi:glutathione S-transferase T3-like [Camellia sinensis]|uniref:glutathione S-transferase T3-like n=1 Tax=Camellia sinensis TaxID=4442 RepID=UPI0010364D5A|nr:glutathione S-transferase T3-like [Camellia sinensis]
MATRSERERWCCIAAGDRRRGGRWMDSSRDPFFTNLLQEGSNLDNQFMKSQYLNQVSQGAGQESQFSTKKESATKKSRNGNFSKEEDNLLISAWLNTSLDAVHGNEQKSKTFWRRVGEYFHEHKTFISERTDNSLMNRWSIIQLGTNKFCGYFAQIESMRKSGVNEQDKEVHNTSFPFKHCWNVLRHQPKWFETYQKKNPKWSRNSTSSPSTPESVNLEENEISRDTHIQLERPIGKKKEKERLKKLKSQDTTSSPIVDLLIGMKEEKKKGTEKKLEMLEKSYIIHVEKAELEKLKEKKENHNDGYEWDVPNATRVVLSASNGNH